MTALEFLKHMRDIGHCVYSNEGKFPLDFPSNGELKRWLEKKCVWCNGGPLDATSIVTFPVTQLVYNWKGKMKCTMEWTDSNEAYIEMMKRR